MRKSKPITSFVQPKLGNSSSAQKKQQAQTEESRTERTNSLVASHSHINLAGSGTKMPRQIQGYQGQQNVSSTSSQKAMHVQTTTVLSQHTANASSDGTTQYHSNQIEAQSTQDRSPLLLKTPKPPRPEKSSTILSSESAAMNLVRSNRAEKEKLIGLRKVELQSQRNQQAFQDDMRSQTSSGSQVKPTPSQMSQSSSRHGNLSTYLSPKVKTSRNTNVQHSEEVAGKALYATTSQMTPRSRVNASSKNLLKASYTLEDQQRSESDYCHESQNLSYSQHYQSQPHMKASQRDAIKASQTFNSQLVDIAHKNGLGNTSQASSSQKGSTAQVVRQKPSQTALMPKTKKSPEKQSSSKYVPAVARKSTKAQPSINPQINQSKTTSSLKQKVVQQSAKHLNMSSSNTGANQSNRTSSTARQRQATIKGSDASLQDSQINKSIQRKQQQRSMLMHPSEAIANTNGANQTEVGRREASSSATRMAALQKQASRFIKAQKSHEKAAAQEEISRTKMERSTLKKASKVQTTVQRAQIDLKMNANPKTATTTTRERSMTQRTTSQSKRPLDERLNQISEAKDTVRSSSKKAQEFSASPSRSARGKTQNQLFQSEKISSGRAHQTLRTSNTHAVLDVIQDEERSQQKRRSTKPSGAELARELSRHSSRSRNENHRLSKMKTDAEVRHKEILLEEQELESTHEHTTGVNHHPQPSHQSPKKQLDQSAEQVRPKVRKGSISTIMQKYQTCNLSSSSAKQRDFNASMHSVQSVKQLNVQQKPLPTSMMKHQVKLAKLDLSGYGGSGPGYKLSKSPEQARGKVSLFDSQVRHGGNNKSSIEEQKHASDVAKPRERKPHINSVQRELHFNQGKTRSLSSVSKEDFVRTGELPMAEKQNTSSSFMNRSGRSGLMPSASQPNNLTAMGDQIEDLSVYKQMLQDQEQKLAEQKRNIQQRLVAYERELNLKQTLKKKIKPFTQNPEEVPIGIFILLTAYDGGLVKKFAQLCKGFRRHILFEFKRQMDPAIKAFKAEYEDYFEFHSLRLWESKISFGTQEGTRVDQVLKFRIKSPCSRQSIIFGCSGDRYEKTNLNRVQNVAYKFDCFAPGQSRWQWLHKEEREFHGPSDVRSYSIPVIPVCAEDYIEISVTIMSLMGVLDPASIKWKPCFFEQLPDQEDIRNYNRLKSMTPDRNKFEKYFADLKRVCEVEDAVVEWFDRSVHQQICQSSLTDHLKRQIDDFLAMLDKQFDYVQIEVGGIDFSVWKIHLRAKNYPEVGDEAVQYADLNIGLRVIPLNALPQKTTPGGFEDETEDELDMDGRRQKMVLTNEVKKVGVIIDRGQCMEFRPGDELIIYVSMGGFEK